MGRHRQLDQRLTVSTAIRIVWMRFRFLVPIIAVMALPLFTAAQTKVIPMQGGTGCTAGPGKSGQIPISDGTKLCPGDPFITANTPAIVNKAGASIGGATVKTLTDTITATTAGNSLIVSVCAGEVANGGTITLTMTETGGSDTWTLAAVQAVSTTFACSIYYTPKCTGGVTAAIATFAGGSSANTTIAMYTWEVSGLIAVSPQALDTTAVGTATGTTLLAGQVLPNSANEYAFAAFGVGTAAQTVTLSGSGTWNNDSGQVNPTSPSGLFSFVGASQWFPAVENISAGGTITSEPWVAVLAVFRPVVLPTQAPGFGPIGPEAYAVPVCTAAMTSTTSTVTVAAPAAGLHNYITAIIVTNSHASVGTFVLIQDGSGGTALWEGYAGISGGGFAQSFGDSGLRQPTAGNGLYVADVTTGANVIACATGYTGP
jgi:hypothetical protein